MLTTERIIKRSLVLKVAASLGFIFIVSQLLFWGIGQNFFWRQLCFWFLGAVIFLLILKIKFSFPSLVSFSPFLGIAGILLVVLPLLFGGVVRGSSRWIFIGSQQSFQPSELAKPIFALFLATFLSKSERNQLLFWIKTVFLVALFVVPLLLQPDLGTAVVFIFIAGVMIIFSSFPKKIVLWSFLGGIPVIVLLGHFFLADYQKARIKTFLNPHRDPLGAGYNLLQSEIAFGSGRWLGRGLGWGGQTRLAFLPEKHTDFIFASLGESFGFLGVTLVIIAYLYLFLCLWKIVFFEKEPFAFLLKIGLLGYLWFQTIVGMGMNIGLLPVTGLPIPFLSYGGSALISSLISLALIFKE